MSNFMNFVPGQVVFLMPGTGLPRVQAANGTYAVIGLVEEYFAVTTAGRLITIHDEDNIVTGTLPGILDSKEWRQSSTARQLHAALNRGIEPSYSGDAIIEEK